MAPGHLRSSCPEPPKSWEADFNQGKAAFWGPKVKQSRPQWSPSTATLRGPQPHTKLLIVLDAGRKIALDTCSEVSIGSFQFLKNIRLAKKAILIEGVGGMVLLREEGDVSLAGNRKITVFGVGQSNLPPNTQVLLGIEHLKGLRISLDFALHHPFCEMEEAIAAGENAMSHFGCQGALGVQGTRQLGHKLPRSVPVCDSALWTAFCLFLSGLCLSKAKALMPEGAPGLSALDLSQMDSLLEFGLFICLALVVWRGQQVSQPSPRFAAGTLRHESEGRDSHLSPELKQCLKRMH
jgi:hypothetical protein